MLDNVTNRSRFSAHASKDSDRPKWLLGFRSHSLSGAFDAIRRMATAWLAPKNIILMLVAPSSTTVSIGLRYQILCDNECSAVLRYWYKSVATLMMCLEQMPEASFMHHER
uniref:SLC12 domain-containing protein n=1 Tax=Ascaris lumbricoides TaxID=6252 RepID=A0A0M3HT32_ASCLU